MNSNYLILSLSSILVVGISVLFGLADNGNVAAAYALGVVSTVLVGAIFWSFSMFQQAQAERARRLSFVDNAQENERITQAQFKTQAAAIGAQNKIVTQLQADNSRIRREATSGPSVEPVLRFTDGIFDELDG